MVEYTNMSKDIKTIVEELEVAAQPFLDELKARQMEGQAEQILGLIKAIESNALNSCASLYLLLQSEMYDEIEKEGEAAAESLMFLYNLMAVVYGGAVLEMIYDN